MRNIKSILKASSFVLTASFAFAAHSNRTADLWYFPSAHTFGSNSEVKYEDKQIKFDGGAKAKDAGFTLSESLSYAPIEKFLFGLTAPYSNSKLTALSGASVTQSGMNDPEVFFAYRFLDQDTQEWNFDGAFTLSPSIGKHKEKNSLRGSTTAKVDLKIGQKNQENAYAFGLYSLYTTSTKSEGVEEKSKIDVGIYGDIQHDFNEQCAGYGRLTIEIAGDDKAKNGSFTLKEGMNLKFEVGPKFSFGDKMNLNVLGTFGYAPSASLDVTGGSVDAKGYLYGIGANFVAAF